MPKFFDKQNLTEIQKQNWNEAVQKYTKIQDINFLKQKNNMSESEKQSLLKQHQLKSEDELFKKIKEVSLYSYNNENEKSALFNRLLNGKNPLLFAPPCSFSYPWYECIENNGPWEVNNFSTHHKTIKNFIFEDKLSKQLNQNLIMINQSLWEITQIISDTCVEVTFGHWKEMGFYWHLQLDQILARDSEIILVCSHDSSVEKITTMEQLKKEERLKVQSFFDQMEYILNPAKFDLYMNECIERYGQHFGVVVAKNTFDQGRKLLNERRNNNKPDIPTQSEFNDEFDKKMKFYQDNGYSEDENGNLVLSVWRLHKKFDTSNIDLQLHLD